MAELCGLHRNYIGSVGADAELHLAAVHLGHDDFNRTVCEEFTDRGREIKGFVRFDFNELTGLASENEHKTSLIFPSLFRLNLS